MDGITFIGTATTIVRLGSFTVLTDPNFLHRGQRAYLGKGLWSRRLTEPAMQPADLPSLDAVVLSHLHGDHFDRIARRQLDHTVPVVTTEHAASRLRGYGFSSHGLQPWSRYELTTGDESLTVESLPAVHAYGALGKLLPPVMALFWCIVWLVPYAGVSTSVVTHSPASISTKSASGILRSTLR